jgi:hypothetical protein
VSPEALRLGTMVLPATCIKTRPIGLVLWETEPVPE